MRKIGKYEILGQLGAGGMAVAYKARDTMLNRVVAVKLISRDLVQGENAVKRFLHEARIAAALSHPNIVTIHELGIENGLPFIAMEYLPGQDLADFIHQQHPFTLQEVLHIALQIASALQHAHAAGVIHRDIKPQNIRILANNVVKLMDFGIAKMEADAGTHLTRTGAVIGTIAYMSPEQIQGVPLTPASDIFSFGVVLYETLTYVKPFTASNTAALLYCILSSPPPPIQSAQVPEALKKLIEGCLEKTLDRRFTRWEPILEKLTRLQTQLQRQERLAGKRRAPEPPDASKKSGPEKPGPEKPGPEKPGLEISGGDSDVPRPKTASTQGTAARLKSQPGPEKPDTDVPRTKTVPLRSTARPRRRFRVGALAVFLFSLMAAAGTLVVGIRGGWLGSGSGPEDPDIQAPLRPTQDSPTPPSSPEAEVNPPAIAVVATTEPTPPPQAPPTLEPTPPPTSLPVLEPTPPPQAPPTLEPTPPPQAPPTLEPTSPPQAPPTLEPTPPPQALPTLEPTPPPQAPPTLEPTPPPQAPPTLEPTPPPASPPLLEPTPPPTFTPAPSPTPLDPTPRPSVAAPKPTPLPKKTPKPASVAVQASIRPLGFRFESRKGLSQRSIISADQGEISFVFAVEGDVAGTTLIGDWIAEDVGSTAPASFRRSKVKLDLTGPTQASSFSLYRPESGWLLGQYRLEMRLGARLLHTQSFQIVAESKAPAASRPKLEAPAAPAAQPSPAPAKPAASGAAPKIRLRDLKKARHGRSLAIEVEVTSAAAAQVVLYYKGASQPDYGSSVMGNRKSIYRAVLQGREVVEDILYYVVATDASNRTSSLGDKDRPLVIQVPSRSESNQKDVPIAPF